METLLYCARSLPDLAGYLIMRRSLIRLLRIRCRGSELGTPSYKSVHWGCKGLGDPTARILARVMLSHYNPLPTTRMTRVLASGWPHPCDHSERAKA